MALLTVLLLLSLTLGLSYAAMRSQGTASMIQRNSDRRASARQDAITGMSMALKKMSRSDWGGVGTSLNGSLGTSDSFLVTYTTGDSSLSASDADQPFRVTLLSTGYSADPQQPQSIAIYRVRAVVRLIPRQVAAEPSDWPKMQGYTLYQTDTQETDLDIPCQFTGPVRLQAKLDIASHYPNNNSARSQYISDLNSMRLGGWPDYRPFNGPVNIPFTGQDAKYFAYLTPGLGITVNNTAAQKAASDWVMPTSLTTYQVYPGGPAYTVQAAPATLSNTTLNPDPTNNPLGLFFSSGNVTISSNVTINGSLFCGNNITIAGTKVALQAAALPSLAGTTGPVRLAAACCQNFTVNTAAGGQATGPVTVFDTFQINQGSASMAFSLAGQLVAKKICIQQRVEWNQLNWGNCYKAFQTAKLLFPLTVKYFPDWMNKNYGCSPASQLNFGPESPAATYHWASSYNPIFVANASDGGLRWDLLSWTENV
jgi:hypothetical protein